jgi:uncharacterized membrane protein (UPF0127 family)
MPQRLALLVGLGTLLLGGGLSWPEVAAEGQAPQVPVAQVIFEVRPGPGGAARADTVRAELADTDAARERGLMLRSSLAENGGMLFVYPEPIPLSFWMKDTWIPLDLAFLDDDGVIVGITTMEPLSETWHASPIPVRYALEVRGGWFEERGIQVGHRGRILFPD